MKTNFGMNLKGGVNRCRSFGEIQDFTISKKDKHTFTQQLASDRIDKVT